MALKFQAGPLRLHLLGEWRRFFLTLYVDDVRLIRNDLLVLRRNKQKLMSRLSVTDMGDVSLAFGVDVIRDREKGTVTITKGK